MRRDYSRKPLDKSLVKAIARLMHLHHQTHPKRLAERFGVTPVYIRRIYAQHALDEQPSLREALRVFINEPCASLVSACTASQDENAKHEGAGNTLDFARDPIDCAHRP